LRDVQHSFQPDNSFVTFCAVRCAHSSTKRANPLHRPELQVKTMLGGRSFRCAK